MSMFIQLMFYVDSNTSLKVIYKEKVFLLFIVKVKYNHKINLMIIRYFRCDKFIVIFAVNYFKYFFCKELIKFLETHISQI
jgi:hypothetical protein